MPQYTLNCYFCSKLFAKDCYEGLAIHLRIHTSERPWKCTLCVSNSYRSSKSFKNHQKTVHYATHKIIKQKIRCAKCKTQFKSWKLLAAHKFAKHNSDLLKCIFCSRQFSSKQNLNKHFLTHTNERNFPCYFCADQGSPIVAFKSMHTLNYHLNKQHLFEKPFECLICNFKAEDPAVRDRHHTLVHKLGVFRPKVPCNICGKKLFKNSMGSHLQQVHKKFRDQKYTCYFCLRIFSTAVFLTEHIRTHTCERPYQCDKCKYSAIRVGILTVHANAVHKPPTLECKLCNDKFQYERDVQRHLKNKHVWRDGKVSCYFCDKEYTSIPGLQFHILRHTWEYSFPDK